MKISDLHFRILQISRAHKLGHLSSNLTAVGIIDEIYRTKRPEDVFVLSCGHAGLAQYVCLEAHEGKDADALYLKHRTHPSRDLADGIHVSSGSLGCGITVALGMAMANKRRNVYCLISDGESYEGSCIESLNLAAKFGLTNLKVYLNANGYSCIERAPLPISIQALLDDQNQHGSPSLDIEVRDTGRVYGIYPFLRGVEAHYHQLKDKDWAWVEANR